MGRKNYTPNDNRNVIRMLSARYAGSARGRNRILFLTVVLSVVTLTMVFGVTQGKIRAEELKTIRMAGTAASGTVEKGNASQYAALQSMDYMKQTGRRVTVGPAESVETGADQENAGKSVCLVEWADTGAWEKLICPAYTNIHGSYPERKQEIILSEKALDTLGIRDPQKGMDHLEPC